MAINKDSQPARFVWSAEFPVKGLTRSIALRDETLVDIALRGIRRVIIPKDRQIIIDVSVDPAPKMLVIGRTRTCVVLVYVQVLLADTNRFACAIVDLTQSNLGNMSGDAVPTLGRQVRIRWFGRSRARAARFA
jgi:hypothetical protein